MLLLDSPLHLSRTVISLKWRKVKTQILPDRRLVLMSPPCFFGSHSVSIGVNREGPESNRLPANHNTTSSIKLQCENQQSRRNEHARRPLVMYVRALKLAFLEHVMTRAGPGEGGLRRNTTAGVGKDLSQRCCSRSSQQQATSKPIN